MRNVKVVETQCVMYNKTYNKMEYINGHCKTNLDDYEVFVKKFYRVPNIGERVACRYKGYSTDLKVCQITHTVYDNEPYIIVELHK